MDVSPPVMEVVTSPPRVEEGVVVTTPESPRSIEEVSETFVAEAVREFVRRWSGLSSSTSMPVIIEVLASLEGLTLENVQSSPQRHRVEAYPL